MTNPPPGATEVGRYKVFINKSDRHVLALRFPDRDSKDTLSKINGMKPLALRMKPKSRLVELDVPLPDKNHIDRRRAIELGQGYQRHKHDTKNAPVGIAGGFGNAPPVRAPANASELGSQEEILKDFDEAMREGKVMNQITFSGLVKPFSSTDPTYYLGTFKEGELHLTKVSAFCTLGPGLQHLDAIDLSDKMARRAAHEGEEEAKESLMGMQAKTGEERVTDEGIWKGLLNAVHAEKWQDLEWVDDRDEDSWTAFNGAMFVDEVMKGQQIMATMSQQQYLDMLSAPRVDPKVQGRRIKGDGSLADDGDMDTTDASDQEEENQQMTDVRG